MNTAATAGLDPAKSGAAGDGAPEAIVIGSGFGGLAAAIRLSVRGYRVTVLEKLDGPGGRASVFRQDGFTFDAGPTIITAPFLIEELWSLCGKQLSDDVDLRAMMPFFRMHFDDGEVFDYCGDPDKMRAEVARLSPGDVAGYERFLKRSATAYRLGYDKMGDMPFTRLRDMLAVIPDMLKMQGLRSLHSLVSSHVKDPRLQTVLSFHPLLIGGNPFSVTAVYALISYLEQQHGVFSAMGGTGALVDAMVRLMESQGARLRLNAEVEEITVDGGKVSGVRLASGETLPAKVVVSNADSAWTYRHLLRPEHRRTWTDRKIERAKFSSGLFVWYFGTNKRYEEVPQHSIILGPRYKGLLDDIFKNHRLADDFSLYLHRPTELDSSLAPEGCDTFYVLAPVPHLASGTDWEAQAEPFRKAIEQRLHETVLPELGAHVVTSKLMTPLDFQSRLLAFRGAAFSFEPILTQSAWFRPHNVSEEVENLFLVGAGTHPGAGIPGVITSAKVLDKVVPHASVFA
ncbi:MAG: phytoene desaturase [Halieaceae bacterium]|nr:phytoene desaturase [Halieaceae bacterium]